MQGRRVLTTSGGGKRWTDKADAPRVVVVNRTLAREIAELRGPVGSKLTITGREHEVIAMVDVVVRSSLGCATQK